MTDTNGIDLWIDHYPVPMDTMYKYQRGHLLVLASSELVGATRLAASAANRIGTGVVSVLSPTKTALFQTCLPPDIIVRESVVPDLCSCDVVLGGSGGIGEAELDLLYRQFADRPRLLDAGALLPNLTSMNLNPACLLTPHEAEFARAFPDLDGPPLKRAQEAARRSEACILLKGPQTIIAHPDGRTIINDRPNAFLAKAGSGDVVAGFIAGLMAQGMEAYWAACAGAWFLSECGDRLGPGLIGSDLDGVIPEILWEMNLTV